MTITSPAAVLDPIAEGRRLAARGRYREAISAVEPVLFKTPGHSVAIEAAAWRHEAFYEAPRPKPQGAWPPAFHANEHLSGDTLPETPAHALTPARIAAGVIGRGALIVRGLLDRASARRLRGQIDAAFTGRERDPQGDAGDPWHSRFETPRYDGLQIGRGFMGPLAMMMADSPAFLSLWSRFLHESGLAGLAAAHLREPPILSAAKLTLYRATPKMSSGWHQDGRFLGEGVRSLNLWVALSDCGVDAPGLQFVPWRLDRIVRTGTGDAKMDWVAGDDAVREVLDGRQPFAPRFSAGDAVLFDEMCLHRSYVTPRMTRTRYAVETWLFAPSTYSSNVALIL